MIDNLRYEDYQQMIGGGGAEFSVAEGHGIMTGMLCIDESISFDRWQNEIQRSQILNRRFDGQALKYMVSLFDRTGEMFAAGGFEFSPCLPDDESQVAERADALSKWCQGFLYGLGHANVKMSWPGECNEIINDLIAISRLDPDSDDGDDEISLVELIEYVRVAVELIRADLQVMYDQQKMH